jgi:tetratricopeptide (TPR) repeat protein
MFHLGMWRERLRNAFADVAEGRTHTPPPANIDEVNDAELADGIGTPLADAAARSDRLLAEIIELYAKLGDRPFAWSLAKTTTDAVLRNSFTHARVHLAEYMRENGDSQGAVKLAEDAVSQLRAVSAPPLSMGTVLYNLACVRVGEGNADEALALLKEGLSLRPDLKEGAASDADLESLRGDPRFQEIVKS